MRDGGLMHILRFYRPDTVYLFLSKEIVEPDRADQRIAKTFAYLRENWGSYQPPVIRKGIQVKSPERASGRAERTNGSTSTTTVTGSSGNACRGEPAKKPVPERVEAARFAPDFA